MMKKHYQAPILKVVEFEVERGYSGSVGNETFNRTAWDLMSTFEQDNETFGRTTWDDGSSATDNESFSRTMWE